MLVKQQVHTEEFTKDADALLNLVTNFGVDNSFSGNIELIEDFFEEYIVSEKFTTLSPKGKRETFKEYKNIVFVLDQLHNFCKKYDDSEINVIDITAEIRICNTAQSIN